MELTYEEAESILRAHDVATGETPTGAVNPRVREVIMAKWPRLRVAYDRSPDKFYCRADRVSERSTHEFVLCIETWDQPPSASYQRPARTYYAAPEANGAERDQPFVTVLASGSEVTILCPWNVPHNLRADLLCAVEAANLFYSQLDEAMLHKIRAIALRRWLVLVDEGRVWWDGQAWQGSSLCEPRRVTQGEGR